jgi:hypothetical protein
MASSKSHAMTNAELIAKIRKGGAVARERQEYIRRVEKKSHPDECKLGHKMCALVPGGPCSEGRSNGPA